MEAKVVVSLLILSLVSAALAKGGQRGHDYDWRNKKHDDDKKCPQLYPSHDIPNMKCSFSGDGCSKITCSMQVESKSVTMSLEFSSAAEGPASGKITLKIPSLPFEWSHTFKSGEKIQVPGFPLKIKGIGDADMYLMLNMYKGKWGGVFKVTLSLEMKVSTKPLEIVLLKGVLPRMGHEFGDYKPYKYGDYKPYKDEYDRWSKRHRFASWFKRQSTAVKVSIILSAVLVFLMVVSAIAYYCKKRRSHVSADKVAVEPPSYEEATYPTKTKVPMEPLVNED